jgi:hypothetical protein
LQTLLAEDDVEAAIVERQLRSTAEVPFNRSILPCRVEHGLVDVDADDFAFSVAHHVDAARDKPGSAGNIENTVAGLALTLHYQIVRPWLHNWHGVAGIGGRAVIA